MLVAVLCCGKRRVRSPHHPVSADDISRLCQSLNSLSSAGRLADFLDPSEGLPDLLMCCRIPEEIRRQIRADWATGQYTKAALARKYGVGQTTISRILNEG